MKIDDAMRIRLIRALLGMNSRTFAALLDIEPNTLTHWEKGVTTPNRTKRDILWTLCQEHGIAFSPSGYPFPLADCMIFTTPKENQNV